MKDTGRDLNCARKGEASPGGGYLTAATPRSILPNVGTRLFNSPINSRVNGSSRNLVLFAF